MALNSVATPVATAVLLAFSILALILILAKIKLFYNVYCYTKKCSYDSSYDSSYNTSSVGPSDIYSIIKETTYKCLNAQDNSFITPFTVCIMLFYFVNRQIMYGVILGIIIAKVATRLCALVVLNGNYMTALACDKSLSYGFATAYSYGAIGSVFVSCTLLLISWLYQINGYIFAIGIAFGISFNAFILRSSGGIYTKSSDVGADLLGKISEQMQEDSLENPLFIADNIGDNVGDAFAAQNGIIEAAAFGLLFIAQSESRDALILFSITFISTYIGTIVMPMLLDMYGAPMVDQDCVVKRIRNIFASTIAFVFFVILAFIYKSDMLWMAKGDMTFSPSTVLYILISIVCTILITVYYTYDRYKPIQNIVAATEAGYAPLNVIRAIGESMTCSYAMMCLLACQCFLSILIPNLLLLSSAVMIGLIPLIMATDLYGPICDNAGGIAVAGKMPSHVRHNTDYLDQMGNMSKALTKSYTAIIVGITCIAAITAKSNIASISGAISFAYSSFASSDTSTISICMLMMLVLGVLWSSASIFAFAGNIMSAVDSISREAMEIGKKMLDDVYRSDNQQQLALMKANAASIPVQIMNLAIDNAYGLIKVALIQMIIPAASVYIFSHYGMLKNVGYQNLYILYMLGLQIGSVCTGALMSVFMTICGGAMDNVSKCIDAKYDDRKDELKAEINRKIDSLNASLHLNTSLPRANALKFNGKCISISTDKIDMKTIATIDESVLNNIKSNLTELQSAYIEYSDICRIVDGGSGGDVVGDPLKDAAGNSITSMIVFTFMLTLLSGCVCK
jgi:K(+)-stimulated pyrophosphate-energized sodium pump